jgi:Holliday junction resolvase RusA-like endonuclease
MTTSKAAARKLANKQGADSTLPITFTVEGVPRPKARARLGKGGRWYTPHSTKAYEEAVGWAARDAGIRNPYEDAVRLEIMLWLPDRRRRDVDNCAKSICDGLNGIAYLDDSQIIELTVRRGVDRERPRAVVTVEAVECEMLEAGDDVRSWVSAGLHVEFAKDAGA